MVVVTPLILVDGLLALRASSPWSTAGFGCGSFRSSKIEGLGKNNDTGLGIGEVALELCDGVGVDRGGIASSSDAWTALVNRIHVNLDYIMYLWRSPQQRP